VPNEYGWQKLPTGDWVTLGDGVTLGNDAKEFKFSPLQIQGSRHLLCVVGPRLIAVGCLQKTAEDWLRNLDSVGKENGYTPELSQTLTILPSALPEDLERPPHARRVRVFRVLLEPLDGRHLDVPVGLEERHREQLFTNPTALGRFYWDVLQVRP